MTWQPIETAPKDGTEILCADCCQRKSVLYWSEDAGDWVCRAHCTHDPVVWQPLPEGPDWGTL